MDELNYTILKDANTFQVVVQYQVSAVFNEALLSRFVPNFKFQLNRSMSPCFLMGVEIRGDASLPGPNPPAGNYDLEVGSSILQILDVNGLDVPGITPYAKTSGGGISYPASNILVLSKPGTLPNPVYIPGGIAFQEFYLGIRNIAKGGGGSVGPLTATCEIVFHFQNFT